MPLVLTGLVAILLLSGCASGWADTEPADEIGAHFTTLAASRPRHAPLVLEATSARTIREIDTKTRTAKQRDMLAPVDPFEDAGSLPRIPGTDHALIVRADPDTGLDTRSTTRVSESSISFDDGGGLLFRTRTPADEPGIDFPGADGGYIPIPEWREPFFFHIDPQEHRDREQHPFIGPTRFLGRE